MSGFSGVVLVLAAGASRRLGRPKQRVRCGGESLLGRSVRVAAATGATGVYVVVGYRAELMRRSFLAGRSRVSREVRWVRNPRWREGMGRSFAAGIRAVGANARAVLVCVSDQPQVRAEDLRALVSAWRANPRCVAAARYGGRLGVPAIFPRSWFWRLGRLSGDRGARAMLASTRGVVGVPMPRAAFDLDFPQDLARLRRAT